MARELYVYWKLPAGDTDAAVAAALTMQRALARGCAGLVCRLHRRADDREGQATLMETYAHPDGVDAGQEAAIDAAAAAHLARWASAKRHVEVFESLRA